MTKSVSGLDVAIVIINCIWPVPTDMKGNLELCVLVHFSDQNEEPTQPVAIQ